MVQPLPPQQSMDAGEQNFEGERFDHVVVCTSFKSLHLVIGSILCRQHEHRQVVIGGAYTELAPWLTPGVQAELYARVRTRPWDPGGLAVSALRWDGPVVGAATSVVQRVISDPSSLRNENKM